MYAAQLSRAREADATQIVERIARRFPAAETAHIGDLVGVQLRQLEGRPIRMYVGNLVEHAVKAQLITERT